MAEQVAPVGTRSRQVWKDLTEVSSGKYLITCDVCGLQEVVGPNEMPDAHLQMRQHVGMEHPNAGSGYGWTDDLVWVGRGTK